MSLEDLNIAASNVLPVCLNRDKKKLRSRLGVGCHQMLKESHKYAFKPHS